MNGAIVVEQVKTSIKTTTYNFIKRTFGIIVSMIGLLFLLPIALIVKLTNICTGDFGKMFFSQSRIGLDGKEFKMYKFRTMVPNADEALKELLEKDEAAREEYRINKKLKNDPRISKAGRVIRKLSIDELPQLFNVFWGDMSMIGNRPYLPREKADMGGFYDEIIKTKPGITGYWQVSGRSNLSFMKRLQLESYYSDNKGLVMDLKIFLKTFTVVLFGRDAS